jgi:sugar diacid utilization regulator
VGHLTETNARIVLALADNGMKVHAAAKALHYGRTTVDYHLLQIRRRTGLNPKNFHDLQKLVKMARATLREETEHD